MEKLDRSFLNSHRIFGNNGYLIISQAFFKSEQNYCKHIVNGFKGLDNVIKSKCEYLFKLKSKSFDNLGRYLHNEGIFLFKKKDNFNYLDHKNTSCEVSLILEAKFSISFFVLQKPVNKIPLFGHKIFLSSIFFRNSICLF